MKKFVNIRGLKQSIFLLSLLTLITLMSCSESKKSYNENQGDLPKPTKLMDKFSYLVGQTMGKNFERDSIYDVNYDYLIQAIDDVLEKRESLLSPQELDSINNIIQELLNERSRNKIIADRKFAEKAKEESFKFLEENKSQPGVVTLPSGLQYKILKKGAGSSPKFGDYIKINAIAKFIDGSKVPGSEKHEKSLYLQLKEGLLLSWMNALPLMKKGAKWILYSPAELAFGDKGTSEIPPNKLIIFEIELLDFQVEPYPDMPEMPPQQMPGQQGIPPQPGMPPAGPQQGQQMPQQPK